MWIRGLTVVAVAFLVPVATAGAVTVSGSYVPYCSSVECSKYEGEIPRLVVTVRADDNEQLDLLATQAGGTLVVEDAATAVRAGAGCSQDGERRVFCAVGTRGVRQALAIGVEGGPGADRVVTSRLAADRLSISGGAGDDALKGDGMLLGGPGDDALTGGAGPDVLVGDDPGSAGRDVLDGQQGTDEVSYVGRRAGVRIDLPGGTGGLPGEQDVLKDVEDLTGGTGDDVLIGDGGPNAVNGGPGRDRIEGGAGRDSVGVSDGDQDDVRCGAGVDEVGETVVVYGGDEAPPPDLRDRLAVDCERLLASGLYDHNDYHVFAIGRTELRSDVLHLRRPYGHSYDVSVVLRSEPGRRAAVRRSFRAPSSTTLRVRLPAALRDSIRRNRRVVVELRIAGAGSDTADTAYTAAAIPDRRAAPR